MIPQFNAPITTSISAIRSITISVSSFFVAKASMMAFSRIFSPPFSPIHVKFACSFCHVLRLAASKTA